MMVRHLGQVAVARIAVLPPWKLDPWPAPPGEQLHRREGPREAGRAADAPLGLCTDEEFMRRAYLDTTGMIPTPDEARAFLGEPEPAEAARS